MSDGGLRQLYKANLPAVFWQPVESFSTGRGVPDVYYCDDGSAGWIENKLTHGWSVKFETGQVAWHEYHARKGGLSFVAVRRVVPAGPRRGDATDELWLFRGTDARRLELGGLLNQNGPCLLSMVGGPRRWDWNRFRSELSPGRK